MSGDALLTAIDSLRERNQAWVQVDMSAPGVGAVDLAAAVNPLLRSFGARRWWFVRKEPGVRVRVEAAGDHDELAGALLAALAPLGPVAAGVYEPELYRFGGAAGLDVAHDHFALDTALAVQAERRAGELHSIDWSLCALGDLSSRLVDDPAELWDAWKRLEELLATVRAAQGPHAPHPPHAPLVDGERRQPAALVAGSPLANALAEGNARVARRLKAAPLHHGLGPRTWFAAIAVFHWNRLGFGPGEMAAVVRAALGETPPQRTGGTG